MAALPKPRILESRAGGTPESRCGARWKEEHARTKFSHAEAMFFTQRGLEQATDEIVAAYKARRFRDRVGRRWLAG